MTLAMALVFGLLALSVVLLVTEWIPMEVTALLVLGATALTGLVRPGEAIAGFSNPAVVTVWAVFILSAGLTRTGVAHFIGRFVLRVAGRSEAVLVAVLMVSAGGMSAVMNNVAVAALLMPVVMDIARHTGTPSSRLLMPLAYGSLLGGLTTMIGTPPNILVSDALRENGLAPFGLFDFTPIGLFVMAAGVLFMTVIGRRLLPDRGIERREAPNGAPDLARQYGLAERVFRLRLPEGSYLDGRSIAETRLGGLLGLNILGIGRRGRVRLAPAPGEILQAGDRLLVEGRRGRAEQMREELGSWSQLRVDSGALEVGHIIGAGTRAAEVLLKSGSPWEGRTIGALALRTRLGVQVLAVRRGERIQRVGLKSFALEAGDRLLVQGPEARLAALAADGEGGAEFRELGAEALREEYHLEERLLRMQVPPQSPLVGRRLADSRLGEAVGACVVAIERGADLLGTPAPDTSLEAGDRLLVLGRQEDLELLHRLGELAAEPAAEAEVAALEDGDVGLVEIILSPHGTLGGRTLKQIHFREKYGLSVIAIWRGGRVEASDFLGDVPLQFGDALLAFGPRDRMRVLGREPDFVVLTAAAQEHPRLELAWVSLTIMAATLLPVLLGVIPIAIAAVLGAAVMVLARCLTMEEAYRAIEWKGIFLIAGMMPLGMALDRTGAAAYLAGLVVGGVGHLGPMAVMVGLMLLTFLATCVIPTSALVVLMTPVVLSTAADLGASPHALMMAMAMAASASFMTPISHPANIMVMGPGGYRFADYLKAGVPLTLVVLVTVALVLPWLWPLAGP